MTTHTDRLAALAPGLLDRALVRPADAWTPAHDGRPLLARRERILHRTRDAAGSPVVATTFALHHRDPGAPAGWYRLGWAETGRVRYDAGTGVLELTGFAAVVPHRLRLPGKPGHRLMWLIRERVAATVAATTRISVDGRGTAPNSAAVITARRRPDTAELVWVVRLADDADPTDPQTQALIDTAIRELRVRSLPIV